ncbi:MAG: hypothetical protein LKF01_00265 [Lactobacillus sp.]|jgi:putative heme iron utilization protein|nr:hypothetical protein [Lactobacillus sp.]MCH4067977.1 hypothetical protein [Lactobacillus sp.]MCI1304067.1 hypothetical protein [Lactobacillus sp.]MCI1329907.1 hypothetical protein [Lactobacillus sp.]MCI1399507.1 hypothetical protein [Lactobacillus sp.]
MMVSDKAEDIAQFKRCCEQILNRRSDLLEALQDDTDFDLHNLKQCEDKAKRLILEFRQISHISDELFRLLLRLDG